MKLKRSDDVHKLRHGEPLNGLNPSVGGHLWPPQSPHKRVISDPRPGLMAVNWLTFNQHFVCINWIFPTQHLCWAKHFKVRPEKTQVLLDCLVYSTKHSDPTTTSFEAAWQPDEPNELKTDHWLILQRISREICIQF